MSRKDPRPALCPADPAADGQASLRDLALDKRRRWEAALAQGGLLPAGLGPDELSAQIAQAGKDLVARLAMAMLQEGVLQAEPRGGGVAEVPIPHPGDERAGLLVRGLQPDSPSLFPRLQLFRQDGNGTQRPVEDPIELLELVAPAVQGAPSRDLSRFAGEVIDGLLNDALCRAYRSAWNERLREAVSAARQSSFWGWLKERPDRQNQTVLLEQWGAVGHPYHPTHKTRLGMTPAEVLAFCPEFEPQVQVGLVAARRELTRGETMPGAPPREQWLDSRFPAQAEAWRDALAERGHDPGDYVALPVHPWQVQHVIPKRFSRSIASGDLVLLPTPTIPCAPLVSVRTLVPSTPAEAPHLKLSLGLRLTSVERTISPRSCEMGPRVSKLLQGLTESDDVLSSTLRILPEEAGMYYASADPEELEEARHLAALLRCNPYRLCAEDDIVVPATALTADSPMTGAPLFLDLLEAGADAGPAAIRTRLADYAETFLRPLLTLYLRYGIGLEAHQQNTLALYSRAGGLQGFIFRDFGGIRIHEASLRRAGLDLEIHPDRLTVVDERAVVRRKLISRALLRHLGFLVSRICQHLQTSEGPFWSDIAEVVQTLLDDLQGDVAAATWRQDRAALLDDDWNLKANLRMRLEDLSHDVYVQSPNPFRRAGQERP